ncbi:conserved hypothetical protein [Microbacterium sp. 8M]|jgi:hypothetical protein|uniref:hypothetical protein n=1 Tax=Microbacterium sp. 8M TaxID=2653153 RepID=UPI0012F3440C|nr:hypothetical protein [Microbacterium sp. 8M]VXB41790.1 conserved hypothetical protein [Microbacterium sp. 8M]
MDIDELKRIVREEDLEVPVLYGVGERQSEGVVLERDDTGWKVYVSDERGGVLGKTLRTFDNEPEALEYVLQKARQGTRYHRALRARSA